MPDASIARRAMIDSQLRPEGVTDPEVLAAFAATDRAAFAPAGLRDIAHMDRALPTEGGRAMMPPAALGKLLDALAPRAGERALVYAPASGYAAALLSAIGLTVDEAAAGAIPAAGAYDVVLVDGALPALPAALAAALADGGRIATGLSGGAVTRLASGVAAGGRVGLVPFGDAAVPPVPGSAAPSAFTF